MSYTNMDMANYRQNNKNLNKALNVLNESSMFSWNAYKFSMERV